MPVTTQLSPTTYPVHREAFSNIFHHFMTSFMMHDYYFTLSSAPDTPPHPPPTQKIFAKNGTNGSGLIK